MRDLISKRTRTEFREHLVGFTLREIDIEFGNEDFSADLTYEPPGLTGQRRTLVEQYYRTINFRDRAAATRLLSVFQAIVEKTKAYSPDHAAALAGHLRRDGVDVDAPAYRLPDDRNPHLEPLLGVADRLTAFELAGQIERMRAAIDADPALAIGTAKELVETTCKTILQDAGKPPASTLDLGNLVKAAMAELKLVPDDIDDRAKGVPMQSRKRCAASPPRSPDWAKSGMFTAPGMDDTAALAVLRLSMRDSLLAQLRPWRRSSLRPTRRG